jgi:hypothetical protein
VGAYVTPAEAHRLNVGSSLSTWTSYSVAPLEALQVSVTGEALMAGPGDTVPPGCKVVGVEGWAKAAEDARMRARRGAMSFMVDLPPLPPRTKAREIVGGKMHMGTHMGRG